MGVIKTFIILEKFCQYFLRKIVSELSSLYCKFSLAYALDKLGKLSYTLKCHLGVVYPEQIKAPEGSGAFYF